MSSSTSKTPAITPRQTMRGHTDLVRGIVHLPDGRRIITGSLDGSLRLWDLERGAQIGEEWRDRDNAVWSMALSPNGKIIASGSRSGDYSVRLWDVETRKVISRWTGHTDLVCTLCWSGDSERVASGSWDGTARVWDVDSDKTILTIKTGHGQVYAVMYSPDSSKLAIGGYEEDAVEIWDAKTGELLNTLKHTGIVCSLAWTSDGKKLISGSIPIRIFDTASWQQITILRGHMHTSFVNAISLSQNNRLLASTSWDHTARLWNLDTNLPVGPPLQHEDYLRSATLSPDGKVLVTGCQNTNAYTWDIHAILKEAGLEDLLLPIPNVPTREPLMNSNATRRPPIQARRIPQDFFDSVQNGTQSSAARGTNSRSPGQYPRSTRAALLERFSSLFRHSHSDSDGAIELQQRSRWSMIFSHRGPSAVVVPTVQDRKALFVARRPERDKAKRAQQQQTQSHSQTKISSSHNQSNASTSGTPPAPTTTTPCAKPTHSRLVRLLSHLVLFLCCASPQLAGGNAHPTQQQSQGQAQTHATSLQTQHQQGQSQAQASSSQTQPTAPSTSATLAVNAHTTAPGAASGQLRPLPLRTRFVLFLCCASLPHADGH